MVLIWSWVARSLGTCLGDLNLPWIFSPRRVGRCAPGSVIETFARTRIRALRKIADRPEIIAPLVRDHNARLVKLGDPPRRKTRRGLRVSPWLNENIEHIPVCGDRSPEPALHSV